MSADAGASRAARCPSGRARSRTPFRRLALVTLVTLVTPAAAHLGNISTSEIVARGNEVDFRLRFAAHLIPGTGAEMAQKLTRRDVVTREGEISAWLLGGVHIDMGGARCQGELVDSMGPDMNDDLTVVLHYACPAASDALRVEFRAFDKILPDFENIASIRHSGGSSSYVFTAASRVLVIGGGAASASPAASAVGDADASPTFYRFFRLGIEHIFGGYDHLLFLLALLLPGGSVGRLAGIVTAFTVAHAITLALAVTGLVPPLPAAPIEAAIAASVALAAFNATGALRNDDARDHRALLTFGFGLVHGFAFAGLLRDAGLPAGAVAMPLFAINVGIEAAELAVVLIAAPLIYLVARSAFGRRLLRATAWLAATVGTFWLAERLAAWTYP